MRISNWSADVCSSDLDPRVLRGLIGAILLGFTLLMHFQPGWTLSQRAGRSLAPFVGFAAGLIGGIASFFSPPLLMFLVMLRLPKDEFVGTIDRKSTRLNSSH